MKEVEQETKKDECKKWEGREKYEKKAKEETNNNKKIIALERINGRENKNHKRK